MNTPYPELLIDTTAIAAELAAWNRAIQRSIDEYHTHPQSSCPHNGACTRRYRRNRR